MIRSFCLSVLLVLGCVSSSRGEDAPPETTAVFHQDLAWSPDGKTIAFMSDRSGKWQIFTAIGILSLDNPKPNWITPELGKD